MTLNVPFPNKQSRQSLPVSVGKISARLDRLPATRTIWKFVVLLSLGFFFGIKGVASFIRALFLGLFFGTICRS
jgi:MFS transporter, putative metabolite:H+ symporter